MNGWSFAAVAVVCVTAAFVAVLCAVVRTGQGSARGLPEKTSGEAVSGLPGAVERARREREGGL